MKRLYLTIFCLNLMLSYSCNSSHEIDLDPLIRYYDLSDSIKENKGRSPFHEETAANQPSDFVTISLGCNCHAAWYTREHAIRTYAFPFDWCLTPYEALYSYLKNDFEDYFLQENLIASSRTNYTEYMRSFFDRIHYTNISEGPSWVLDKKTGMVFNHDFLDNSPQTIMQQHSTSYQKYMRRIKRLYEQVNSDKYIYFIRHQDITKDEAIKLYELLRSKFPKAHFTLIVVNYDPNEFGNDWCLPHIKNYCPRPTEGAQFWKKLCDDISSGSLKN